MPKKKNEKLKSVTVRASERYTPLQYMYVNYIGNITVIYRGKLSASTSAITLNTPNDTIQMIWRSDQSNAGVNKWGGTGHAKGVLADTLSKILGFKCIGRLIDSIPGLQRPLIRPKDVHIAAGYTNGLDIEQFLSREGLVGYTGAVVV